MKRLTIILVSLSLMLFVSTASGGWEQQSSGTSQNLQGISFGALSTGTAVGGGGVIVRTTDDGATWFTQSSGIGTQLYDVHFIDNLRGTTVGDDGAILHTTDGGGEWDIAQNDLWVTYNAAFMYSSTIAFAVGANTIFQPLVERTINGWHSWRSSIFYLDGHEGRLYDVHFIDNQTGFAAATAWDGQGRIVFTTDGGSNWSVVYTLTAPLRALDFPSANIGYAVGHNGGVIKTTDGGASWNPQSSGIGANLAGVSFASENTGTAVGAGGMIIRTTDGGANWYQQASGTGVNLNEVDFIDQNNGYIAGDSGTILYTSNGGDESANVPTLSEWGMIILALLFLLIGTVAVIRKRKPAFN